MMHGRPTIHSGLVSVTFRQLTATEVIAAAAGAKLEAIEWGGDVHVPHGDLATAKRVGRQTIDAGLAVAAYGSYYRAADDVLVEAVLDTAAALGAPTVRVWAGRLGSSGCDVATHGRVTDALTRACDLAATLRLTITLEYHGGTLTDTLDSTLELLRAIGRPNLLTGWQPRDGFDGARGVSEIERLRPALGNLHVFQWWPDGRTRLPLADGAARWASFLRAAAVDRDRYALLEFVTGDDPARLLADAACLHELLADLHNPVAGASR